MHSQDNAPVQAVTFDEAHAFRWKNIDWTNFLGIGGLHVGCILAFFPVFFTWSGLFITLALWWVCGGWGICIGYHRLLTHRSFHTPKWFEYFLTALGTMNWQGGPIRWVGVHRIHHKESDHENDPHSPQHGFTWAHMFWTVMRSEGLDYKAVTKDLQRDPVIRFMDKWFYLPLVALGIVLFASGWLILGTWTAGVSWLVWGVFVRTVFAYHATWFVNSAAHTWGYRNFETADGSRNNWWVALISFGEGWHNNHHAQQRSAAHGMRWWEIDPSYWTIRVFEWVGLARRVVRPKIPGTES